MKTTPAGFLAVAAGWAFVLPVFAVWQNATQDRITDMGPMAFWTGLFALVGWAILVRPILRCGERWRVLRDRRWSWLSWSALATLTYSVIVPPMVGIEMFEILWYPAIMGVVAGAVFAQVVERPQPLPVLGAAEGGDERCAP